MRKPAIATALVLAAAGGTWWAGRNPVHFISAAALPAGTRLVVLEMGGAGPASTLEVNSGEADLGWGFAAKNRAVTYQLRSSTGEPLYSGHFTVERSGPTTVRLGQ